MNENGNNDYSSFSQFHFLKENVHIRYSVMFSYLTSKEYSNASFTILIMITLMLRLVKKELKSIL